MKNNNFALNDGVNSYKKKQLFFSLLSRYKFLLSRYKLKNNVQVIIKSLVCAVATFNSNISNMSNFKSIGLLV